MRRDMAVNMTDEKALQWYVPPGCVKLYQLLRAQGDTPDAAVRNVFAVMQVIMQNHPCIKTKPQRRKAPR